MNSISRESRCAGYCSESPKQRKIVPGIFSCRSISILQEHKYRCTLLWLFIFLYSQDVFTFPLCHAGTKPKRQPWLPMATDWAGLIIGLVVAQPTMRTITGPPPPGERENEREQRPRRVFTENTNIEPLRHFSFTRFRCSCWFFQQALRSPVICRTPRSQRNALTVAEAKHDVPRVRKCSAVASS